MATGLSKAGSDVITLVNGYTDSVITLEDSNFLANGHVILSEVPPNVTVSPSSHHTSGEKALGGAGAAPGCFVGFDAAEPRSHHVASIGNLRGIRFMSIFRFKVWWTTHWVGTNGRDLEHETQMVILDRSDEGSELGAARPYVLLLPLLEGPFRTSIQPGPDDFVDLCVESGSTKVTASGFRAALYMHTGDDPFALVKDAIKVARDHLGTFKLLEEKTPPGIVDKFGWCTRDAFYPMAHPEGIWNGIKGLVKGGCPPGLVLINDGWQPISLDEDPVTKEGMNHAVAGEQMPCGLLKFQENHKFRDYASPSGGEGMGAFVRDLKEEFGSVDYVYVCHALCGYWGGLSPGAPGLPESSVVKPKLSPGLETTMEDLAVDKIVNNGVGLVPPELVERMCEGLDSQLESAGIDGVKVDVFHLLEMMCENHGRTVELAKAYYKALKALVRKHFKGNGVIASMEHCNDFLGTDAISLGRVSEDFWCTEIFWLQGCHMVHCAYNSLWMGNFFHPDWDMFQSTHPCALFHAASRAISGGPIYVTDLVREHDFELLRRLVLPDGSILRCEHYALPTRDCLFVDPLHDGKTMLKIWNLNKYTGVIGAFNCQGGSWCREYRRNKCASQFSHAVSGTINPADIEWSAGGSMISVDGVRVFALYLSQSKRLVLSKPSESVDITLEPFQFELVTVSPVKELTSAAASAGPVQFAPIGLVNMLNPGGAIRDVKYGQGRVEIEVRGRGKFSAYASTRPSKCSVNGRRVGFEYEEKMVVVQVSQPRILTGFNPVSRIEIESRDPWMEVMPAPALLVPTYNRSCRYPELETIPEGRGTRR